MDPVRYLCANQWFAVKPRQIYFLIRRDQDTFGRFDFFRRQHIFCAVRSLRFYFDRNPQFLPLLLQAFRRHKRMRNPGRARRNRQHPVPVFGSLYGSLLFLPVQLVVFFVYDPQKFLRRLCRKQQFLKFRIH